MGLVYDLRLCLNHSEKTHGGEFQGLGPDRELKPILLFGSLIKIFGKGAVVFRDSPPDDLQIQPNVFDIRKEVACSASLSTRMRSIVTDE